MSSEEIAEQRRPFLKAPFAQENRGRLLDIVVFLANMFLMGALSKRFIALIRSASGGDRWASYALFLFVVGLFFLAPAGAVLKRWQFNLTRKTTDPDGPAMSGCLFNPVLYLSISLIVYAVLNAFVFQFIYGDDRETNGGAFVGSIFFGIALSVLNTYFVYRYFSPPRKEPLIGFFRTPLSAALGDICIFLNMLFFQLLWNIPASFPSSHPYSISDLFGRVFILAFASLLIYFPPRIFYLYDDIEKRGTWITIGLANLPLLIRFLIGY